jgi:hypothetical protein
MKHSRVIVLIGGLAILAGLALMPGPAQSLDASPFPATQSPMPFSSSALNLKCDIKVPNGLAQCGSQASSCKNCHEVKGEDPVNAEGDWHVQHAFGDFCEFCHGGNVQTSEKDAAHQGLVAPLGDTKTNCASCHDNFETLSQTYATALGVTIGTGGGSTQPSADTSDPREPDPTPGPAPDTAPAPSGGEIVDYVAQYQSGGAPAVSAGNLVVGALLVATVFGGGAFAYWNEKRLRKANPQSPISASSSAPVAQKADSRLEIDSEFSPELTKLLPTLQSLDPQTLRALRIILSDRPRGEAMLQSLSLVNFAVLDEMKRLDKRELSLLLALAGES